MIYPCMRRRQLLTSGIAVTGTGLIPISVAADESGGDHDHRDTDTEYLGQDEEHIYLGFERNGEEKLNIVHKDTDKVVVKDRESGEQEFVIEGEIVEELHRNRVGIASHTPWSDDVNYTDEDLDGVEFGSQEIIKRAGRRWESLGHCDLDCNVHRYNAECFEFGKEVAAVSKTLIAAELWNVLRKKGPQWLVQLLTKRRLEDIVTSLGTLAAGNTITFALVDWDQSLPVIDGKEFISCRAGLTDYKPAYDTIALQTYFQWPGHQLC